MLSKPITSVVIPAFNAGRFIERTLRSVLLQTYRDFEVIVVDDGSTDDTKGLAMSVAGADRRFRILSIPNNGVANARNLGIREAKGEYVAFLDADDLWHPSKLQVQVAALENQTGVGRAEAVYSLSRIIDIHDRFVRNENAVVFSGYSFARHLFAKPVGNGSSILVRRDVALSVGGFDPRYAERGLGGCEDIDFELKIAARYPLIGMPLFLVGYRAYPGNMSSNRVLMARSLSVAITAHLKAHPELPRIVVRSARADIREYALSNFITGGHWASAAREFFLLLNTDFELGITLSFELLRNRLIPRLIPSRSKRAGITPACDQTLFYDLSPSPHEAPAAQPRRPRDQKILERLEVLDAALGEYLSLKTPVHNVPGN